MTSRFPAAAPAPAGAPAAAKTYFPDDAPEDVQNILLWLSKMYAAHTMTDMHAATQPHLAPDVDWQLPFIQFSSSDEVRTWYYAAHAVASEALEAKWVEVQPSTASTGERGATTLVTIHIHGVLTLRPKLRTWLVWPSMLLPKAVALHGQWRISVLGPLQTGQVQSVHVVFNNLPNLPSWLRAAAGWAQGGALQATEHLWGPLAAILGDEHYRHHRQQQHAGPGSSQQHEGRRG